MITVLLCSTYITGTFVDIVAHINNLTTIWLGLVSLLVNKANYITAVIINYLSPLCRLVFSKAYHLHFTRLSYPRRDLLLKLLFTIYCHLSNLVIFIQAFYTTQHLVDAVRTIQKDGEAIDLHMIEVMEMMHKTATDTTYVVLCTPANNTLLCLRYLKHLILH